MDAGDVNDIVRALLLKDLRVQCRARGISPAGSREALADRLRDHMLATGDFALRSEGGAELQSGQSGAPVALPAGGNNYHRSEGQNVGNFLTDRPSSRVLAPPGGGASHFNFGDDSAPEQYAQTKGRKAAGPPASSGSVATGHNAGADSSKNNYHRAGGQNVGNFLTDRNSSRVLAPPGGASQVSFG